MEDNEAYWLSLEGEDGRCGGDSVPGLDVPNLGEAIRDDDDTTELGLGGGKCGEAANCRSGVPFAWKNLGVALSSPTCDPDADALELCGGGGMGSPFA